MLERTRVELHLRDADVQAVRSVVLDAAEIATVAAYATSVSDPDDNPFIDVLDQTEAEWLCTDDGAIHRLDRPDVVGIGELTTMLEGVCDAIK